MISKLLSFCTLWQNIWHLVLHDLVHHLPQQVGQVELVNVHGKVKFFLKAKTILLKILV